MQTEETQDQTPATQAGEGQDFDNAWNEFAGSASQTEDQPPAEEEEEEATPTEEATPDDAASEETTPPETTDPLPAAAADESATLRAELEAERHKRQSDSGRISAFQRKIQQLEDQLSQMAQPKAKAGDEGDADQTDPWETVKEIWPEVARGVEARYGTTLERIAELKAQLAPLHQAHQENARNQEFAALEAAHSDWREVAASNNYRDWLAIQSAGVQELHKSSSAVDAAAVLTLYKTQTAPAQPQPDPAVARIQAERSRRLASAATTVPGKGSAVKPLATDNFEDAWDYFANRA